MNLFQRQTFRVILTCLTLISILSGMIVPHQFNTVVAQEATSEPAAGEGQAAEDAASDETESSDEETPTPEAEQPVQPETTPPVSVTEVTSTSVTETPAATAVVTEDPAATDETAATPTTEVAAEVTTEATPAATGEATAAPTSEATSEVTAAPVGNFQQGTLYDWVFSPGWSIVGSDDDAYLTATTPGEIATVPTINWDNLLFTAKVRAAPGNTAGVTIRSGYAARIDAEGGAALYKDTTLLAEAPATATPSPEAVWRALEIQAVGSVITVAVDGVVIITYDDPEPLGAGSIILSTGSSSGEVSFTDVSLSPLDAPVEITEAATLEATAEATAEPTPDENIILSADFESELSGWLLNGSASVVENGEANHVLLMEAGSSLFPAETLYVADLTLDARINFVPGGDGESGIDIILRDDTGRRYLLTLAPALVELYRIGTPIVGADSTAEAAPEATAEPVEYDLTPVQLASVAAGLTADVWYTVSIAALGGSFTVTIDGATVLEVSDDLPLIGGSLALSAAGGLMIDDIIVTDYTTLVPIETPTPLTLEELAAVKLTGNLIDIANLYLAGDEVGALAAAGNYFVDIDEANRLSVIVYPMPDAHDAAVALLESSGGVVDGSEGDTLHARISLTGLVELVRSEAVGAIRLPALARSTDPNASTPRLTPAGTVVPHSLDIHGANDWHEAGIVGGGVKIAVIDTGFGTLDGSNQVASSSERICLESRVVGGAPASAADHGLNVVEVLCDFATASSVRMYQADTAAEVQSALVEAIDDDDARIVVITLDLGASVSPGDSSIGDGVAYNSGTALAAQPNLYHALQKARELGVIVFASAGNNNRWDNENDGDADIGYYIAYEYTVGAAVVNIPMTVFAGDTIHVSWNDWDENLNGGTLENFDLKVSGGFTATILEATAARNPVLPPAQAYTVPSNACTDALNGCVISLDIGGTGAGSFGDPGAVDFQVQIAGRGQIDLTTLTDVTPSDTAGSLARPADSDAVIAVGAVCANQEDRYAIMRTSSMGPVYDANGAIPPAPAGNLNRADVKPDLAASSYVGTSLRPVTDTDPSCESGFTQTTGFNGTSAAAAHAAGMAALLLSNTDNASMRDLFDAFDQTPGEARVNALEDYLQAHSVDLFGLDPADFGDGAAYDDARKAANNADGFDFYYGSGLAVLGSPAYNVNNVQNFSEVPLANQIFVGQANMDSTQVGSAANPFLHLAEAIRFAVNDANVDTIIVQPGEYVTGLEIDETLPVNETLLIIGYDEFNTGGTFVDPEFWVNDSLGTGFGGIVFNRDQVTFNGFILRSARPAELRGPSTRFILPSALSINVADEVRILNSEFSNFANSIVVENSDGVDFIGNRFFGFTSENSFQGTAVLDIVDSGDDGDGILIARNEFNNNIADDVTPFQEAIINSEVTDGQLNREDRANDLLIQANTFSGNRASTILRVRHGSNDAAKPNEVVMTSNQILFNALSGPVVHLQVARTFRFINNAVINNGLDGEETKETGFEPIFVNGLFGAAALPFEWEIHNNLFYSNQTGDQEGGNTNPLDPNNGPAGVFMDDLTDQGGCGSINGGATFRNNWFWRTGLVLTGECSFPSTSNTNLVGAPVDPGFSDPDEDGDERPEQLISIQNPNTGNNIQARLGEYDRHSNFFSEDRQDAFPATEQEEQAVPYIFLGGRVNSTFNDEGAVIEAGDNIAYRDMARAVLNDAGFDIDLPANYGTLAANFYDLNGKIRRFDPPPGSNSPHVGFVDIGAIEFESQIVPLEAEDFVLTIEEDEQSIELPLVATGGFQPYDFSISQSPTGQVEIDGEIINTVIYNTAASTPCNGQPFVFNRRSNRVRYCPPPDFYTDLNDGDATDDYLDVPDEITLQFSAGDILTGDVSTGTLTLYIDERRDLDPVGTEYNISVVTNELFSFRLRPYADFTNNFRRSQSNFGSDYPYSYNVVSINDPSDVLTDPMEDTLEDRINNAGTDGLVEDILPTSNRAGVVTVVYEATDTDPDGTPRTTTNTVTISVVNGLVGTGVYDDTSIEIGYSGTWTPLFSEPNINNSLHTTTALDAQALLVFEGNALVLYLQGDSKKGGLWTFEVENNDTSEVDTLEDLLAANRCVFSDATVAASATSVVVGLGTETRITNKVTTAHTIACDGFEDEDVYTVRIINRQASGVLSLDAVEVIDRELEAGGEDILRPGTHEVTDPAVAAIFDDNDDPADGFLQDWQRLNVSTATRGVAMVANVTPDTAPLTFDFKGAGIAIGTARVSNGAQFQLCVQRVGDVNQTCQTFDNSGATRDEFGAYRTIYGFDNFNVTLGGSPDPVNDIFDIYQATITPISTAGQRLIIDDIIIIGENVPPPMPLGVVEADDLDQFVYGGFNDTTWLVETADRRASNGSLVKQNRGIYGIGPFISFIVPGEADTILWQRATAKTASRVMICVDRAQFGDGACTEFDLNNTATPNPIAIRDDAAGAWGEWEDYSQHTIEIFSLTNAPFDMDYVTVLSTDGFLGAGVFDDSIVPLTFQGQTPPTENDSKYRGGTARLFTLADASALFRFEGTGFGVQFLSDTNADAVRLCWAAGNLATREAVLAAPDQQCQSYDNESSRAVYGLERAVRGLAFDEYTAFVQFLGDQGQPAANTPNEMVVDGITVYGEDWTTRDPLPTGTRYETSFVNPDQLIYYGAGWTHRTNQTRNSGANFDTIRNRPGAGIVFQVAEANVLTLIRDTKSSLSPVEICAAGINDATLAVETDRTCVIAFNDGGTANQQAFNFALPEAASSPARYVVTINTINTGEFILDALEAKLVDNVLQPGVYDDSNPALRFSAGSAFCNTPGLCPPYFDWTSLVNRSFNGGSALILRSTTVTNQTAGFVDFTFEGTGFAILNLFDVNGQIDSAQVELYTGEVDPDASAPFYTTDPFTTDTSKFAVGNHFVIAGLEEGIYTVRVEDIFNGAASRMVVDGVQIFGSLSLEGMLPGLYDDRATASDGTPFLNFLGSGWERIAGTGINQTLTRSLRAGASVVFSVDDASAITLFYAPGTTNTTEARVCWRDAGVGNALECNDDGAGSPLNLVTGTRQTVNLGSDGDYIVSITNLQPEKLLPIDAIGVSDADANFEEGIHQDGTLPAGGTQVNNTTATDGSVRSLATGQSITLNMEGVGFSIVAVGGTANSSAFTVSVDGGGDIFGQIAPTTLPTSGLYALSRVGLTNAAHSLVITNTSANPLLIDRIDVISAPDRIDETETGQVNFSSARIKYLPIGLFSTSTGQALSTIPGSAVYFEFDDLSGDTINYFYTPLSTGGTVTFCRGAVGNPACAATLDVSTTAANLSNLAGVTGDVWGSITNRGGGGLPFLATGLNVVAGALFTPGVYSEDLLSPFGTTLDEGTVLFTTTAASGGLFKFEGTGFRFNFVRESTGSPVEICWAPGELANVAAVEGSGDRVCQTYNTSLSAVDFNGAAAVNGLDFGSYTAFARFTGTPTTQTLRIDGFDVYNAETAQPLEPGARYETSFASPGALFAYTGTGWSYNSSTRNTRNSNFDFDTTNVPGNAFVFATGNSVDTVVLFRDTRSGFTPLEICAIPAGDPNTRRCAVFANNAATGNQQPFSFELPNDGEEHNISITTLTNGLFNLDAIEVGASDVLTAGLYQEAAAGISYSGTESTDASGNRTLFAPQWSALVNNAYSGGAGFTTTTNNASFSFAFEGTGFEIGTPLDRAAGDFEVCYEAAPVVGDVDAHCYTYNTLTASNTVSRTVAGLPFDEYAVVGTNLTDSAGALRQIVDFVRIFDDEPIVINEDEGGLYNDNATASPETLLLSLPSNRWTTFSGTAARGASFATIRAIVDNSGRASSVFAGPVAVLRVDVPAEGGTVVFDLGSATRFGRSGNLVVCVDHVDDTSCSETPVTTLATNKFVIVNLPADDGIHTITLRMTEPSDLRIDSFNVIFGNILGVGFHDDQLVSDALLNDAGESVLEFSETNWARRKDARSIGGSVVETNDNGATLDFSFEGTGFSIVGKSEKIGLDFLVCYEEPDGDGYADFPTEATNTALNDALAAGVFCQVFTTDTDTTAWNLAALGLDAQFNGMLNRTIPRRAEQYGFTVFGLESDAYDVRLRVVDAQATNGKDYLRIDGVAVLGLTPDTLLPGLYDDTDSAVTYEPEIMWTTTIARSGPSRGPWQRTEHLGINAGQIANVQFDSDSMILYHTAGTRSSRYINYCLVASGDPVCGSFSQNGRGTRYLAPIMFYGFGSGAHWLVFENLDHGTNMSIDAIRVMP